MILTFAIIIRKLTFLHSIDYYRLIISWRNLFVRSAHSQHMISMLLTTRLYLRWVTLLVVMLGNNRSYSFTSTDHLCHVNVCFNAYTIQRIGRCKAQIIIIIIIIIIHTNKKNSIAWLDDSYLVFYWNIHHDPLRKKIGQ